MTGRYKHPEAGRGGVLRQEVWASIGSRASVLGFRVRFVGNVFFFFQAEDGIRDDLVTGVQTCALPIYRVRSGRYQDENQVSDVVASRDLRHLCELGLLVPVGEKRGRYYIAAQPLKEVYKRARTDDVQIGRASCRERG